MQGVLEMVRCCKTKYKSSFYEECQYPEGRCRGFGPHPSTDTDVIPRLSFEKLNSTNIRKEQRIISMWFYFAIAITLRRISRVSVRICTKYSCSIVVLCGINIFFSEGHPQEPSFA
mmetsp:Transcript_9426/g.15250  ORF Transcript_9426/g.15250 Transcript_9426/m.15250 type:complete len:116 (-) Transcript_9426:172-519(-)